MWMHAIVFVPQNTTSFHINGKHSTMIKMNNNFVKHMDSSNVVSVGFLKLLIVEGWVTEHNNIGSV